MSGDALAALIDRAEGILSRAGVRRWELCAIEGAEAECQVMDGAIHTLETSRSRELSVRVLEGGIGFSVLTDSGDDGPIAEAVEAARIEARATRPAAMQDFAAPPAVRPAPVALSDPRATGRPRPALIAAAHALEARTLAASDRVHAVRPAAVYESAGRTWLRTSSGLDIAEAFSRAWAAVGALAEDDDDSQLAHAMASAAAVEALELEPVADRASARAERLLGAGGFKTARVPVLLDPEVVAELIAVLAGALAADRVQRGASFLAGKLDCKALGSKITVIDRPHDPDLDGACRHDGEGLVTAERVLIDRGVPAVWLYDRERAAREGAAPNAQAVRDGAGRPEPGAHAPVLQPGGESEAALLVAAEGGLYVHELAGLHTIQEVSGDLSLGVTGWAVRGGAWAEPVQGITIAGNLLSLLGEGVRMGDRLHRWSGGKAPLLLLEDVQVSAD